MLCADLPVSLRTQLHQLDFDATKWLDLLPILVNRIVEYSDTDKAIDALAHKFKWPEGLAGREDRWFEMKVKKELKSKYVMHMCDNLMASMAGISLSDLSPSAVSAVHKITLKVSAA
jgi:hypothetical protein